MSGKIFENRIWWPSIPKAPVILKVCLFENLPAFKTEKELGKYHETKCPSCAIYRKWKCPVCNGYHALTKEMPGSGGSSGNQRPNTIILPRAEWEYKLQPQEPGLQFNAITFTEKERAEFGADAAAEVVRRLEQNGVKVEWDKYLPITDERVTLLFAVTPIHYRRSESGDMMYGWHEKVGDLSPVA